MCGNEEILGYESLGSCIVGEWVFGDSICLLCYCDYLVGYFLLVGLCVIAE